MSRQDSLLNFKGSNHSQAKLISEVDQSAADEFNQPEVQEFESQM